MNEKILHQHLDRLLKFREHCDRPDASSVTVQRFLRLALLFARDLMTEDVFRRAMGSGEKGGGVSLLAYRLAQLEPLLEDNWPSDFTYLELQEELFAIAHGDAPRILKRSKKSGKALNSHRQLVMKLQAHAYYKVLGHLDLKASKRQSLIIDSYGITLDAFNKWRQEAKGKLGPEYVESFLSASVRANLLSARMHSAPAAWVTEQTRLAGQIYNEELHTLDEA